jgi:adenosylcobinamide-GDP ribazoletransferase
MSFWAVLRFLTILPAPAPEKGDAAGGTRLAAPDTGQSAEHASTDMNTILILPAASAGDEETRLTGRSIIYFPLVGLVIGLLLALLYILFRAFLPSAVDSVLLLAALVVITGAHHIDGLMDTCDALVAGRTRVQRLEIMADTRVGAFGITAACLLLLTKYVCLSSALSLSALLTFPLLSRWAITGLVLLFPAAKESGSFTALKDGAGWNGFAGATAIALAACILLNGLLIGPLLMAGLFGLLYCLGLLFKRLFGGLTGDCCGAMIETGEVITLVLNLALLRLPPYISDYNLFKIPFPF